MNKTNLLDTSWLAFVRFLPRQAYPSDEQLSLIRQAQFQIHIANFLTTSFFKIAKNLATSILNGRILFEKGNLEVE